MAAGGNASHWAVGISGSPLVLRVCLALRVVGLCMTVDAGHAGVIGLVDVAVSANSVLVRQAPVTAVIEGCAGPGRGVVASRAGCWEARSNVVRHVTAKRHGALPGGGVATVAVRWEIAGIVVVDVACRAGSLGGIGVRSSKRKTGGAVIELAVGPSSDGMAGGALRGSIRESGSDMVRNSSANCRGAVPGRLVATVAIRGIQCVVVADVAGRAGSRRGRHVRAYQGEAGDAVVERSSVPAGGGVAVGAICSGESSAGG